MSTSGLDDIAISGPQILTGSQINYPNQQGLGLREEAGSAKAVTNSANVTASFDRVDRNTDTEENVDRDIDRDLAANTQQLLQADRDLLRNCITQLQTDLCQRMFSSKEELIEYSDKIFENACQLESKMKETIACQIEDAKCQFYKDLARQYDLLARIAGSSRNSFVVQEFHEAHCELVRKLSELHSRLCMDAIKEGHSALTSAYQTTSDARINGLNGAYNMLVGLWGVLKGANVDATEVEHTDDVSASTSEQEVDQNHFQAGYAETWTKQVEVTSGQENTFLPDVTVAATQAPTQPPGTPPT
jgi:hemoglobin-like flavoprotein